jgi:c-di-GMP-binding flagellar brake protein YcgR
LIALVVWEYDLRQKRADIVPHDAERRRYPRIKAKIPLEILCPSAAPMRTATDEISACGCYIETMFTIDVGTKVDLVLSVNDERIQIKGVVVTKYPQVGNGIDFVDIAPEDRLKLTKFISESN